MAISPSTDAVPRRPSAGAALAWGHAGAQALAACLLTVLAGLVAWSALPALLPGWSSDVVLSGSMAPRFRAGDVVVAGPVDPATLEAGQLALFEDPAVEERTVLHRVVRRLPDGSLITKGDANATEDSTPVPPELVQALPRIRVPWIGLPVRWRHEGETPRIATAALATLGCVAVLALGAPGDRREQRQRRRHGDRGRAPVATPPRTSVEAIPAPPPPTVVPPPDVQPSFWCAHIPPHLDARDAAGLGGRHRAPWLRRPSPAVAASLVLLLLVGVTASGTPGGGAHAAFRAERANGVNEFAADTTFPTYLQAVLADGPLFHHRLDEAPAATATSPIGDVSEPARPGMFAGRTNGPSTHYRYDEGAGSRTRDVSGNANPASLHGGATWSTAGCYGRGLILGTDAYGTSAAPAVRTDRDFTVATWVRLSGTSNDRTLVSQDGSAVTGFALHFRGNNNRFAFGMPRTDVRDPSLDYVESSTSVSADTWYHVAGVFEPGAQRMRLYVNGASTNLTRTAAWNATGPVQLGRVLWEGDYQFEGAGTLADTRLYPRALSPTEIGQLADTDCAVREQVPPFSAGRPGALGGTETGSTAVAFGGLSNAYNDEPVTPGDTFSVELWFRTTTRRGGELLGFHDTATGASADHDRTLHLRDDGTLSFGVVDGGVRAVATTSAAYDDGGWHHVVGTMSPANGLRLYVDGELAASTAATAATGFPGYWRLGGGAGALADWPGTSTDGHVTATLDEVSVYHDVELTAASVTWRYQAGGS
jgi:signal peptidase I